MTQVGPSKTSTTSTTGSTAPIGDSADVPAAFRSAGRRTNRKSSLMSLAVTAVFVPGLFATVALPAYAFAPVEDTAGVEASLALEDLKRTEAQTVIVGMQAAAPAVSRDAFTTTSAAEIQAALGPVYPTYSGPSAADFLANPPYPSFSLDQVAQVALQYQGVPYRYGGSDPSGFDCSGLIQFVYAQFGIALPHSVSGQAALGTPISRDAALPGDIVTMAGHNGIYMGNGTFIDAPDYGQSVVVRTIWTDDYYIYRLGI